MFIRIKRSSNASLVGAKIVNGPGFERSLSNPTTPNRVTNVDNWAHLGGFIGGVILTCGNLSRDKGRKIAIALGIAWISGGLALFYALRHPKF